MEYVKLFSEEYKLRVLLARAHNHRRFGINYTGMYEDDGELQCPHCGCDFMRDEAGALQNKMHNFNLKMLREYEQPGIGLTSKT